MMFTKFLATLSYIKNTPSLFHQALLPDTRPFLYLFIFLRRIYQIKDFYKRKSLTKNFDLSKLNKIPKEKGYLISKSNFMKKKMFKVINRISKLFDILDWNQIQKENKKKFLLQYPVDLTEKKNFDILDLLMEDEIIGRISLYLGQIPILLSCYLWYSPNKTFEKGRSQQFHLDNEDIRQIKLFIPIKDIASNTGPLHAISKYESVKIYHNLKKSDCKKRFGYPIQNQKFNDEIILKFKPKINKLTAKVGNVIFLDTSKCYHYGSRPTKNSKPRCMLALHFVTSQSRELPLWGIKNISVLNNLNIKKFSKEYKNKILNYFFRHYVANKKIKFY